MRIPLAYCADPNQQGGSIGTALQTAACRPKFTDIPLLLIQHGAHANSRDSEPVGHHGSALQAACTKGSVDVAQLLLKHGANAHAPAGSKAPSRQGSGDGRHSSTTTPLPLTCRSSSEPATASSGPTARRRSSPPPLLAVPSVFMPVGYWLVVVSGRSLKGTCVEREKTWKIGKLSAATFDTAFVTLVDGDTDH
jgi:hypothetical protein